MTDKPAESAVERYEECLGGFWGDGIRGEQARKLAKRYTDAAIEELKAENKTLQNELYTALADVERLRVCGNCGHYGDTAEDANCHESAVASFSPFYRPPVSADAHDPCHFTPSRWTERGEREIDNHVPDIPVDLKCEDEEA